MHKKYDIYIVIITFYHLCFPPPPPSYLDAPILFSSPAARSPPILPGQHSRERVYRLLRLLVPAPDGMNGARVAN